MQSFFKEISTFSLQGIFRYITLFLLGKEYYISGACNGCGNCCRKIHLKSSAGWIRSEEHFSKLKKIHPDFNRFSITGIDPQGFLLFTCDWLTASGSCKNHEHRLEICKSYPSKSLLFCGGYIPETCGYVAEKVIPFRKVLEQEKKLRDEKKEDSHP